MTGARKYLALFVGFVLAAVLGGLVSQALAAPPDPFTDIASSPFHDEIVHIAGAGIATGFPDGTYRPRDTVNRQQMAAFINRGGGRVATGAAGTSTPLTDTDGQVTLGSATLEAGAEAGTGGFVVVTGDLATITTDGLHCPCEVGMDLRSSSTAAPTAAPEGGIGVSEVTFDLGVNDGSGQARTTNSMTRVFPIASNAADTFELRVRVFDTDVSGVTAIGHVTAVYVPFSGFGGN